MNKTNNNKLFNLLDENNKNRKVNSNNSNHIDFKKCYKDSNNEKNNKERIDNLIITIENNYRKYKFSSYFENIRQKEYYINKKKEDKKDPNIYHEININK